MPPKYTGGAKPGAALKRAEAKAGAWLDAASDADVADLAAVLSVLRALDGEWPTQFEDAPR